MKWNKEDKRLRFIVSLLIATVGGIIFTLIHTPIPWLLGPMTAILIGARFSKIELYWPSSVRNIGLVIVGYSIGLSFTGDALVQIGKQLPVMLEMTVSLVIFCAGIAFIVSKLTGADYPTVLTGCIPGGLSQMIIFAEEVKGIDITTVTFLQVARLLMIIFLVPFLVLGPLFQNTVGQASNIVRQSVQTYDLSIILFAVACVICAFLAKKIKLPTPFLLGPIIGTAILNVSGMHGAPLSPLIMDLSQFFIGGYIGLLLKPEKLEHKTRVITLAVISGMVMILGSFGLSHLLMLQIGVDPSTSFLSMAPGGTDQMSILAHEIGADLSMVSGFQVFRLLFIYFVVPPILRLIFKFAMK